MMGTILGTICVNHRNQFEYAKEFENSLSIYCENIQERMKKDKKRCIIVLQFEL